MFEDKKENRRKHLTSNKKKESSKRKHKYEDDDFIPRKRSPKHDKEDVRAEEIWEEWENQSDY